MSKKKTATLIDVLNTNIGRTMIEDLEEFMCSHQGCIRYAEEVQGIMDDLASEFGYKHNLTVRPAHALKPGDQLNTGEQGAEGYGLEIVADAGVRRDILGHYIDTESGYRVRVRAVDTLVVCG
jgi:hypothetical protein